MRIRVGTEFHVTPLSMVIVEQRSSAGSTSPPAGTRSDVAVQTPASRGQLSREDLRFSLLSYMENPPPFLGGE